MEKSLKRRSGRLYTETLTLHTDIIQWGEMGILKSGDLFILFVFLLEYWIWIGVGKPELGRGSGLELACLFLFLLLPFILISITLPPSFLLTSAMFVCYFYL